MNNTTHDEMPHEVAAMMLEKYYSAPKAWRKYLRLNQREAAARIGVSQAALSQIENNSKSQTATLRKIADAYNLHVEQLDI
jgi:transcriptional regulator with XRE-family HTH domain